MVVATEDSCNGLTSRLLTCRNTALINLYDDIQNSWPIVFIGTWIWIMNEEEFFEFHLLQISTGYQLDYWMHWQSREPQHYSTYILSIDDWNARWIAFLFNLKAAVTSPESGIHTSGQSWIFVGISNFSRPFFFPWRDKILRTSLTRSGSLQISSYEESSVISV